jgi:hypothetical protein
MRRSVAALCVVSLLGGLPRAVAQVATPAAHLGLSDFKQIYASPNGSSDGGSADVNVLTRGTSFPNPLEQMAVESLVYGDYGRRNAGNVVAFVETFYNSDRFSTPEQALKFFEEARNRYESIGDPKELGQILQGALKTGLSLNPKGPAGSAVSGAIDLFGSTGDLKQRLDAQELSAKTVIVRDNAEKLQFDVQLHPERASPILKKIFTGRSTASPQEFAKALSNLPASKGDVAAARERLEGTVGGTISLLSERIDGLTKQLAKEKAGSRPATALAVEIRSTTELMAKLVESTTSIETSFSRMLKLEQDRATQAARVQQIEQFKAAMANTVSIVRSAGQMLNLPAEDVEKGASLLTGSTQLILALTATASPDPLATAAAGLNLVNLLFGGQSSGTDPHKVILQSIDFLRKDMNRQFDRVNLKLDQIDQDIRLLADYMGKRFDRIEVTLRQLATQSAENQAALINRFKDVEDLINSNYKINRAFNWSDVISDLAAYRDAASELAVGASDQRQKVTEVSLNNLRRDDFLRSMRRLFTVMALDDTGFGYPGIAGSKSCFGNMIDEIKKSTNGPEELERQSRDVVDALQSPTYSLRGVPRAYCVARFVQNALLHIPALDISDDATSLEILPGDLQDGRFLTWKDSSVFTPKHVWEFSHRIRSTLAYVPNVDVRLQVTQELLQRVNPALRILRLTNSKAGRQLLAVAYSELASDIVAEICRTFYNPYMQGTLDYQIWKSNILREVGTPAALNGTRILYDEWTDQVVGLKPFQLPQDVAKMSDLDTKQIFGIQRDFLRSVADLQVSGLHSGIPKAQEEFGRYISDYISSLNKVPAAFDAGLDLYLRSYPVLGLRGGLDESLDRLIENVWSMKILGSILNGGGLPNSGLHSARAQGNTDRVALEGQQTMASFFEAIKPFIEHIIKRTELAQVTGSAELYLFYSLNGAVTSDRDVSAIMNAKGTSHPVGIPQGYCAQGSQFWTNGRKNCFTIQMQVRADVPEILRRNYLLRTFG